MPLLKKPGAPRLLSGVSSTPSQTASQGPSSEEGGTKSQDKDTTSKPKGWLVAIAKDENSNGYNASLLEYNKIVFTRV